MPMMSYRAAMSVRDYSTDELAAQPIGYWSGETYRTVVGRIRADLALESLTQPHWWILNHVDAGPGSWTQASLTERLQPFDDQDTDFAAVFDDLMARDWIIVHGHGTMTLSAAGREGLERARTRGRAGNAQALAGISTEEYVATLNVLRRIIDNLGGNSDIP
jgi:hypothetical protein